jgi:hypothetical protein
MAKKSRRFLESSSRAGPGVPASSATAGPTLSSEGRRGSPAPHPHTARLRSMSLKAVAFISLANRNCHSESSGT